jgi:hypothetical protein
VSGSILTTVTKPKNKINKKKSVSKQQPDDGQPTPRFCSHYQTYLQTTDNAQHTCDVTNQLMSQTFGESLTECAVLPNSYGAER